MANEKYALVTGTNTGIGLEVTVQLAEAGYTVFATVRALEKAAALKETAASRGVTGRVHVVEMDVAADESVSKAVASVLARTENMLDVVVANAGYGDMTPPEAARPEHFVQNMNVNLCGVVRLVNAVLPSMRTRGRGHILVTSSLVGLVGLPMMPVYVATKFAVEGYVESMAGTYAPLGIHFTLVEPGPVETPFMANTSSAGEGALPSELQPVAKAYGKASESFMSKPQSAADCATYFIRAVQAEKPPLRTMTYEPFTAMVNTKFADADGTKTLATLTEMTSPSSA
ncbi:hypothetical protein MMPV_001301 [Pyropia vietnamensis]